MADENAARAKCRFIDRVAHVLERAGLAMAGAMCGTFVAAYFSRAGIVTFDPIGFTASMVLVGTIGFYLGIGIPRLRASHMSRGSKHPMRLWDTVELLGATGTFLAAVAALASVYTFVFDEATQGMWGFVIGSCWPIGVFLQIGAGAIGRLRLSSGAAE